MLLVVHVKPNAKKTEVVGRYFEGTVTVALHAPATEGKANEELVRFLSEKLGIPKTFVMLRRGHHSRVKHVEVPDGAPLATLHG